MKAPNVRPVVRAREQVVKTLDAMPGRHVVLIRYALTHCVHREWVYNSADIYQQPIIWAHEMGPEWDRPFVASYPDRQFWILQPDQWPPKLIRYQDAPAYVPPKPAPWPASILDSSTCPPDLFAPSCPLFLVDVNSL
jgi:hypothetical protein